MRAVIFDLWDTLVEWPVAEATAIRNRLAALVDVGEDEFERRWQEGYRASQTGPLADAYRELGVPDEHIEDQVAAWHELGRKAIRPRAGATQALVELRRRGVKLGVMSVCSEEVPAAWPDTELAGLFDAETFSSECGLIKPDPEIYHHTSAALGVEPEDCFFVGDGANNELAGAAQVGMTPVLFVPGGAPPMWQSVKGWTGLRVTSIEGVLELC